MPLRRAFEAHVRRQHLPMARLNISDWKITPNRNSLPYNVEFGCMLDRRMLAHIHVVGGTLHQLCDAGRSSTTKEQTWEGDTLAPATKGYAVRTHRCHTCNYSNRPTSHPGAKGMANGGKQDLFKKHPPTSPPLGRCRRPCSRALRRSAARDPAPWLRRPI